MIRGSSVPDGPPAGNERTKEEKRLATAATVLWRKGDYVNCGKQLELLSALRSADPSVSRYSVD